MVPSDMTASTYYTLVASLPRLRHFESAEWLPLSRRQLDERLTMLTPEDALQLRLAENLVEWQRQPLTRTSEQVALKYQRVMPQIQMFPCANLWNTAWRSVLPWSSCDGVNWGLPRLQTRKCGA